MKLMLKLSRVIQSNTCNIDTNLMSQQRKICDKGLKDVCIILTEMPAFACTCSFAFVFAFVFSFAAKAVENTCFAYLNSKAVVS